MPENTNNLVTFKIRESALEWAEKHQKRLGATAGKRKVSQADLFEDMMRVYEERNTQNYDSGLPKPDDPPETPAGKPDSRKKPSQMADDALISFGASGTGGTNQGDPQGDSSGQDTRFRKIETQLAELTRAVKAAGGGNPADRRRKQK